MRALWSLIFLVGSLASAHESWKSNLLEAQESIVAYGSRFFVPNEFNNYHSFGLLPTYESGAVVAVGSIRAFNAAVFAASEVFAIDQVDSTVVFNRLIAKLVTHLSREDFLRVLLGGHPSLQVSSRQDFLTSCLRSRVDPILNVLDLNPLTKSLSSYFPIPKSRGQSLWLGWLHAMANYADNDLSWNATFFGNDRNYRHVRNLIRDGHFHILHGSLTGENTLRAIGRILTEAKIPLSFIDVSNAPEHILAGEGLPGVRRLLENLDRFPTNEKTVVLSTVQLENLKSDPWKVSQRYDRLAQKDDSWAYVLTTPHYFKRALLGSSTLARQGKNLVGSHTAYCASLVKESLGLH